MTGEIRVLNVGAGDIAVSFNNNDDDETEKALGMLRDMMARGYLIAVQLPDGSYARATKVDAKAGRYIITVPKALVADPDAPPQTGLDDGPPIAPVIAEAQQHLCACGCGRPVAEGKTWVRNHHHRKRAPQQTVSVPVRKTRAVGVARSAGG